MLASNPKIAVVLPMYNEAENCPLLVASIDRVRAEHDLDLEAIAVNDGSQDNTLAVLHDLQKKYNFLVVVSHATNQGVAQAIKTGIAEGLRRKYEVLIFMDSDLSHDPSDFPKFVKKIKEGYDVAIGSRFIKGGGMIGVPLVRRVISKFGNLIGSLVLNVPVKDFTSGFRALRTTVFTKVTLEEKGFPIQLEETVKAYAAGFKLTEIPIILSSRKYGHSSMVYNWKLFASYFVLLQKCFKWLRA